MSVLDGVCEACSGAIVSEIWLLSLPEETPGAGRSPGLEAGNTKQKN